MVINALNSGAKVFMADFEDANAPTWGNMVEGQANLIDAVEGTIAFTSDDGREYRLRDDRATLMVRPRGWHLEERHLTIDGTPCSGSLFDVGLFLFHNGRRLLERGSGPYLYLAKLEGHLEARLWNDVFVLAQDRLGIPRGSVKATVLIETILAAFEMEEILYELREHSAGLNAGRWDYIFSIIKKFRARPEFVLPDRGQVTMTVPFMRAYTELLVKTCHRRNAFAIGGMAAFIPSRRDPEVTEAAMAKVRQDKVREARDGFDGTWVAHPDLVRVAREVFDDALGDRPNQLERGRDDVAVTAAELLDVRVPDGSITEAGVRANVSVAILYLESWLRGVGAAALFNLMEDTATAEIARSQIWQWIAHEAPPRRRWRRHARPGGADRRRGGRTRSARRSATLGSRGVGSPRPPSSSGLSPSARSSSTSSRSRRTRISNEDLPPGPRVRDHRRRRGPRDPRRDARGRGRPPRGRRARRRRWRVR